MRGLPSCLPLAFAAAAPSLPISRRLDAVRDAARALPPSLANCVTVMAAYYILQATCQLQIQIDGSNWTGLKVLAWTVLSLGHSMSNPINALK